MGEKNFSYRDLEIWLVGMDVAEAIYKLTADFPSNERYGLTSQMRRAAVSIPSNIAEGWGRDSQAALANYVRIARASANELETQLELSRRLSLTDASEDIHELLSAFGKKSHAFLATIERNMVREERAPYGNDSLSDLSPFTFHLSQD